MTAVGRPRQNVRAARLSRKQATCAGQDRAGANEFAATTARSPPSRTPSPALPHLPGTGAASGQPGASSRLSRLVMQGKCHPEGAAAPDSRRRGSLAATEGSKPSAAPWPSVSRPRRSCRETVGNRTWVVEHPGVIPRLGHGEPAPVPMSAGPRDLFGVPRGPGAAASRGAGPQRSTDDVAAAAVRLPLRTSWRPRLDPSALRLTVGHRVR